MTTTLVLEPQTVERPGGRPYRARKPPTIAAVWLCGYASDGLLVLRCHDVDLAVAMVLDAGDTRTVDQLAELARPLWVRWVCDDLENPTEGGSWEREERGTVGATPAVLFAREDPTPRPVDTHRFVWHDGTLTIEATS